MISTGLGHENRVEDQTWIINLPLLLDNKWISNTTYTINSLKGTGNWKSNILVESTSKQLLLLKQKKKDEKQLQDVACKTDRSQIYYLMNLQYEDISISSGSSPMFTSKRSWTSFKTLASVSSETNVIARPFVPNLPARATFQKQL